MKISRGRANEALETIMQLVRNMDQDKLVTPDGIKFWVVTGTVYGVLYNNDSQRLYYGFAGKNYEVASIDVEDTSLEIVENLPLHPCKYGDLKPGEFFVSYIDWRITNVWMVLPNGYVISIKNDFEISRSTVNDCADVWKIG